MKSVLAFVTSNDSQAQFISMAAINLKNKATIPTILVKAPRAGRRTDVCVVVIHGDEKAERKL